MLDALQEALMIAEKKTHRQRQKENTKELILNTAYKLLAERGYANTTMRLLAKEAGVGLGTIFKHFPDKPSLLVEAYQGDLGTIIIEAFKTIPESGIKNQLLHVTGQIYKYYANNPEFSKTLIKESLFLEGKHGKILDEQLRSFQYSISELISAAVKRCELPQDTDVIESTQAYGSFYFSVLVMALKKQKFDVEGELELMQRLLGKYFLI
jgi:AcrR family transcriptional regulator